MSNDARDRALRSAISDLRLTQVTLAGSGLEFSVWRATHPRWGDVALRVPARAIESNANDPLVVTAELQRQEAEVYRSLRPLGVPVPRVFDVLHYDVDVLVCEYVRPDGSAYKSADLGAIVARLHALPVPAPATTGFAAAIADRVNRRWRVLRQHAPALPRSPGFERLAAAIPAVPEPSRLHMDVRASNILTRRGRIEALIDWSNSLIGDPALELARIAEYARLPENAIDLDEFRRGYTSICAMPDRPEDCWSVYHLDTAIMLAVVFTRASHDSERGPDTLGRVSELARRLRP